MLYLLSYTEVLTAWYSPPTCNQISVNRTRAPWWAKSSWAIVISLILKYVYLKKITLTMIFLCWCNVLRWIWCLWCYSECVSTPEELDSVPKYHILEPTRPRSSVGRALGLYSKGRRFDSRRGQAYFSSLPGVDTHSEYISESL